MPLTPVEVDVLLDAKVGELFAKWVSRLKLQDWSIRWRIVRKVDLPADKSGSCDSSAMKKIARIKILHPEDDDPGWLDPYDLELTIVHELVHLHLSPWSLLFEEGNQAVLFLEQAVHALSATLISADRRDRRWEHFSESAGVQDPNSVLR